MLNEFSYWTFESNNQTLIVTDLQGVRQNDDQGNRVEYILTDPVINSIDGRFGNTDLGKDGIISCILSFKMSQKSDDDRFQNNSNSLPIEINKKSIKISLIISCNYIFIYFLLMKMKILNYLL